MQNKQSLLLVAHPGHELMLLGWLRQARPRIVLLTDKESGATRSSLDLTEEVAHATGARLLHTEAFVEADLFDMFLNGRTKRLVEFAETLADKFASEGIEQVVTDAPEGYHTVHDLTSALARTAIELHARRHPCARIEHLEYRVVGDPRPEPERREVLRVVLDDATLQRKVRWLRDYASELGPLLFAEVDWLLSEYSDEAYRFEILCEAGSEQARLFDGLRHYEKVGEQLSAESRLDREVLRYAQHMAVVDAELRAYAALPLSRAPASAGAEG